MKYLVFIPALFFSFGVVFGQHNSSDFITTDITNFWQAYDKISATKDTAEQERLVNELYIKKGTPGLRAIMDARRYTAKSYVNAINNYPLFWGSVRANTNKATEVARQLSTGVEKFRTLYPDLRPAKVYFTIGAFRTPGTTVDNSILIGAELAMADSKTVTKEFGPNMAHLVTYFASEPLQNIVFLNVHEYVHTQQLEHDYNLLYRCLYEGIAEFVAAKTMGEAAITPAIKYGREHEAAVKQKFESQLYSPFVVEDWVYNSADNMFGIRDLGYYIGYAVAENFYNKSTDKKLAIKQMITLDYGDEAAVAAYVDKAGYFTQPLVLLRQAFEKSRPEVTGTGPIHTGDKNVDPSITKITVNFSVPMDKRFSNFELGPAGQGRLLRISNFNGFSEDGKSVSFETILKPGQQYELEIGAGFRTADGLPLKPYLIEFSTMSKN